MKVRSGNVIHDMIHKNGNLLEHVISFPLKRKQLNNNNKQLLNNNSIITNNNSLDDDNSNSNEDDSKTSSHDELNNKNSPEQISSDNNNLRCPVCEDEQFTLFELLERHVKKIHPDLKPACESCQEIFPSFRAYFVHSTLHNDIPGAIAEQRVIVKTNNMALTRTAIYQNSNETTESSQTFECGFCRQHLSSNEFLSHWKQCEHIQSKNSHHSASDEEDQPMNESNDGISSDCNKDDESDCEERKHHFLAGLNLQSKNSQDLSQILENSSAVRLEIKPDLADIKSILSVAENPLLTDMMQNSIIKTDDDCNEDDDPFKMEVRDMKRRGEFPCRICRKIFRNLRALKGHARIHITGNKGVVPYECNICTFTTGDKSAVIRHVRSHNGDHPYKCQLCMSTFTTKANCERHLRNAHRKTSRDDIKNLLIDSSTAKGLISSISIKNKLKGLLTVGKDDDTFDGFLELKKIAKGLSQKLVKPFENRVDGFYTKMQSNDTTSNDSSTTVIRTIKDDCNGSLSDNNDENSNSNDSNNNTNSNAISFTGGSSNKNEFRYDANPYSTSDFQTFNSSYQISSTDLLDMRTFKQDRPHLESHHKSLNDAMMGCKPTVIQDDGIVKISSYDTYSQAEFVNDEPLDLSIDVLDLSKKKCDEKKSEPEVEDLSCRRNTGSNLSRNQYTEDQFEKQTCSASYINKNDTKFQFSNSPAIANSFPTYFVRSPNISIFPTKNFSEPEGDTDSEVINTINVPSAIRPLLFGQLVASAAERYEEIRQNINEFGQNAEAVQTDDTESKNETSDDSKKETSKTKNGKTSAVKMVMKDGVLVEKQKQRRYRTEKPFSCSYCSGRFTLRSNMDRHVKQQHPGFWRQRQRGGAGRSQRITKTKDDILETVAVLLPSSNRKEEKESAIANEMEDDTTSTKNIKYSENQVQKLKVNNSLFLKHVDADEDYDDDDGEELIIDEEAQSNSITHVSNVVNVENQHLNIKEDNPDLASVRTLLDNVSTQTFSQYFHNEDDNNGKHDEVSEEDEEGLVAGSSSEGNVSGSEETRTHLPGTKYAADGVKKKKSAYSSAPNRVHCDFCYRSFPWASSLRRHTLTHTGQKPYKCSSCPLLFTTKSNCDRHFLRKHRSQAVEPAQPSNDRSMRLIPNFATRNVPERPFKCNHCPSSTFSTYTNLKKHIVEKHNLDADKLAAEKEEIEASVEETVIKCEPLEGEEQTKDYQKSGGQSQDHVWNHISSDLPFKCHLCDRSFGERQEALDHMSETHSVEFQHLIRKGALDGNVKPDDMNIHDDTMYHNEDNSELSRGRFPDYSSRKVICAFCLRRFWSAEDLRRHMRTHTGERPFACDICQRRFTLKHSMLRHRKKHSGKSFASTSGDNSPTDDEEPASPSSFAFDAKSTETMETDSEIVDIKPVVEKCPPKTTREDGVDLIAKLLDIEDKTLVDEMLTAKSADDVAKLLGVKK